MMKIIYNRYIPFGRRFYAINLFGVLFAKGPCDEVTLRHESIHSAQIRELWGLPFYALYVGEWIWHLLRLRDYYAAYHSISFEREAYAHQYDSGYLSRRRRFGWRHLPPQKR